VAGECFQLQTSANIPIVISNKSPTSISNKTKLIKKYLEDLISFTCRKQSMIDYFSLIYSIKSLCFTHEKVWCAFYCVESQDLIESIKEAV